jgi:RNA recognition motif-containing protein
MRRAFAEAGFPAVEVSLPRDRSTGRARGFCFVSLESKEQAEDALRQMDGIVLDGRAISVRAFRADRGARPAPTRDVREPRGPGGPPPRTSDPRANWRPTGRPPGGGRPGGEDSTVYVGNLPFDSTEEDIGEFFKENGFDTIRRVHLPTDPEGRKRGFGFVTLQDEEAAKRASETLDGSSFRGRNLGVNLARRGGSGPGGGGGGGGPGGPAHAPVARPRPGDAPTGEGPPPAGPGEPPRDDDWRAKKGDRLPRKDKKKKGRSLMSERPGAPKQRRKNEEFRSSRARDYIDDWEDD